MIINFLFIVIIYFLVIYVFALCLTNLKQLKILKHECELDSLNGNEILKVENYKLKANIEKLKLIDDLSESIFNNFFHITRELLLLQKFIFEKGIK